MENNTNHFRIKAGPSSEDKLNVILPEVLEGTSTFLTNPFGSNKMRFQYPEVFSYSLKDNTLTITKNKNNIARVTSGLFDQKGWNLDLVFSSIPINTEWKSNLHIEKILPRDYGTASITGTIKTSYKYGIMIPTYGRYEYVKKCLDSLKNSNLPIEETLIVIVDESLTKEVNRDKERTNVFIKEFTIEGLSIIKIYKNKHGNMFDSLVIGLDLIYPKCEFLMNLDSDTVHKKDWLQHINNVFEKASIENPDKIILTTGYNSINHEVVENKEGYVIKKSVGGCHLFFKSSDYVNYLRCTIISNKWDTNIYEQVHRLNGIIICTNPSVIEHIGEFSSVRNERNKDKSIDY